MPVSETVHRPFLVASLALATLVGFVLGIHIPVGRLTDSGSPERTADLIQAHGQVQLLGFAGLFVIGMSLRLMPRFASSRISLGSLVPLTLYLIVSGLFTRAVVMPWFDGVAHSALLIASVFAVLLGSVTALLPVFARDVLHTGPDGLGILRSSMAIGALATGLALANMPAFLLFGPCNSAPFITDCFGCVLWVDLLSGFHAPAVTDLAGDICLQVAVPSIPLTIYLQWVVADPGCIPGYRFSDTLHCRISDL